MSWQPAADPAPGDKHACDAIDTVIVPRARDLGGFEVRRALPSAQWQMVGPFIFFDQMGPAEFLLGAGIDVRPHPHIGLSTVTYLFTGEIMHRDSLGTVQAIRPGELNWMTAGQGIVHSERTPAEIRTRESNVAGIQSWVALPKQHEEVAPAFAHHGADALPIVEDGGARVRVIAGEFGGARSPAATLSDLLYADVALQPGARLFVPASVEERAVYIVDGSLSVEAEAGAFDAGRLVVFRPGAAITLVAHDTAVRLMLLGGAA